MPNSSFFASKATDVRHDDDDLFNSSDSTYGPYEPGSSSCETPCPKKLYANTEEITNIVVGASAVEFGVRAVEAGTESNALPNEITELETALNGVTVTNPSAALAQDEESVEALNGRIDAKIGSLGEPGARLEHGRHDNGIQAVAKNGPDDGGGCIREDGSRIDVTRTQVVRMT